MYNQVLLAECSTPPANHYSPLCNLSRNVLDLYCTGAVDLEVIAPAVCQAYCFPVTSMSQSGQTGYNCISSDEEARDCMAQSITCSAAHLDKSGSLAAKCMSARMCPTTRLLDS